MNPRPQPGKHAGPHRSLILTGDALTVLKTLPAGSHDAAFCDPPYGLSSNEKRNMRRATPRASSRAKASGFMGMAWDAVVPGPEVWAEVLRVLKPGAPMLVFGGTRTFHRLVCAIEDAGFLVADTICWLHGQGFPKGKAQLKPAWEPITLAWKKGTRQPLAIDASRIGYESGGNLASNPSMRTHVKGGNGGRIFAVEAQSRIGVPSGLGRWPANLILGEEAAAALDAQSGDRPGGAAQLKRRSGIGFHENGSGTEATVRINFGDSGGASRFFYCAKASRKERGEGNTHPTVKPLKLCEYLARLILPPNPDAKLLVPFSGSGSEMIGARRAGWKHVTGIEREREYVEIAQRRMGLQSSPACSPKKLTAAS